MAKILEFKKMEKFDFDANNNKNAVTIPYGKQMTPQLTIKEWKQKYLGTNRESEILLLYLTSTGVIAFLDQLLVPWELMSDDEKLNKENSLGLLYDQLEKFEAVKNKEYPIRNSFCTEYKEKYFSDFKLKVCRTDGKINDESVLYLDMILILLTKVFNSVFYIKELESKIPGPAIISEEWIVLDHYDCKIQPVSINNKFMFKLIFQPNWNRKRGLLKKLNKKSMLNFIIKLDSKHIFLM